MSSRRSLNFDVLRWNDGDFEEETKMVLEKFDLMEEKFETELEVVENRLDKKIKTINTL